ncbi:MAG: acyl-CoA dehydrogenase, partial [Jatrophihabitantaceae bacterium]|nr:acyl-CoA dehydrogenase [Jatrophihabitantaceae bacterium]
MSDTAAQAALRAEVRAFLAEELRTGGFEPSSDAWMTGFEPAFTQRLAARGWVGMNLPTEYGGAAASALDRVVVVEELLAAGAPVAAHWFAERQIGPAILKHGTDAQRTEWLPRITAGDAYFAIGLSEPGSGSDLASVRTRAVRVEDGWALTGTKVWSSGAHRAHAMVVLARSGEGSRRHEGLTQFIVRLPDPRVTISPIVSISGAHHFNEVVLDAAFVPDSMVLGQVGGAWTQVVSELAYERSGPERFLSTMPLLERLVQLTSPGDTHGAEVVGSLVSSLSALRAMSLDVAHAIERGEPPVVAAAMVKDVGTIFEQDSVAVAAARLRDIPADAQAGYTVLLDQAQIQSPNLTLRGGTNEVLRGIVAKELLSPGWAPPEASGLLFETVTQMLRDTAEAGTANVLDAVWPLLVDAELPWVGVSEAAGGAGGDTADLVAILSAAAGAGRSIPLSDSAFVANWLLDIAGLPVNRIIAIPLLQPDRPLRVDHDGALATVSGRFRSVTWAAVAAEFVAVAVGADGPVVVRLPASAATLGTGTGTGTPGAAGMTLAGEPWADVVLDQAPVLDTGPLPPGSGPLD